MWHAIEWGNSMTKNLDSFFKLNSGSGTVIITILVILFSFRFFVLIYGFDRVPLVSATDETTYNDVALSIAEGDGIATRYVGHSSYFRSLYSQHPPLYFLVKAAIFATFGLTTFTLRCVNIISYMLCVLFVALILLRLKRQEIVLPVPFYLVCALLSTTPMYLSTIKQGRPDMLALLFSIMAMFIIVRRNIFSQSNTRWFLSSVLIGLAISTHLQSVVYWGIYAVLVFLCFWHRNKSMGVFFALFPQVILTFIWIGAFRGNSVKAIEGFLHILKLGQHGNINYFTSWLRNISSLNIDMLRDSGYILFPLGILSLAIAVTALMHNLITKIKYAAKWNRPVITTTLVLIITGLILTQISGIKFNRMLSALPIFLVSIAVLLSYLSRSKAARIILPSILILIICSGFFSNTYYLHKTFNEWDERNPAVNNEFLAQFPTGNKIAGECALWYAAVKQGLDFTALPWGDEVEVEYLKDNFDVIQDYDVIILFPEHPLIQALIEHSYHAREATVGLQTFIVFKK